MVHADPRADHREDVLVLRTVAHEERAVRLHLLEDPFELLGQDPVGDRAHPHVAGDRRVLPEAHPLIVHGDRREDRVHVGVLRVREPELRRRDEVLVSSDEGALEGGLRPDVVIPVDAQDQGFHRAGSIPDGLYIKVCPEVPSLIKNPPDGRGEWRGKRGAGPLRNTSRSSRPSWARSPHAPRAGRRSTRMSRPAPTVAQP